MAWKVYGEVLTTADFSGAPRCYQPVVFGKDIALKAVRTWVVAYNSPIITNLTMRIYSNNGGVPGVLMHTFDKVWTLPEITTEAYAHKEIYFDLTLPRTFVADDTYHFALGGSGYTGDGTSHFAWTRSIPDPINETDISINTANISKTPFYMAFIGGDA